MMFAGQMACEALNFLLKRWIKEERPKCTERRIPTLLLLHVGLHRGSDVR